MRTSFHLQPSKEFHIISFKECLPGVKAQLTQHHSTEVDGHKKKKREKDHLVLMFSKKLLSQISPNSQIKSQLFAGELSSV